MSHFSNAFRFIKIILNRIVFYQVSTALFIRIASKLLLILRETSWFFWLHMLSLVSFYDSYFRNLGYYQEPWVLHETLGITRNLGYYQKPWVLPGILGVTRNLGYYQEPWVLPGTLGITRKLEYYQEPWVLSRTLGITRNLGYYQEPWVLPGTLGITRNLEFFFPVIV